MSQVVIEMGYGAKPTGEVNPPVVVTHSAPAAQHLTYRIVKGM